ncbi:hypothetical protein WOLCODRAFT_20227 [Wolfiporia cocos MD-104 SS10]|uniref:Uncharacterized protein n=1 Tax=Wolfiporia cocos (strain MD-104) TaxID=742152 RepID=A0A2H3J1S3_WOLCO|nr:hypothetical protein WOLCODRAFT_20227 [Wolfiporia cocos MD-104 SS10]
MARMRGVKKREEKAEEKGEGVSGAGLDVRVSAGEGEVAASAGPSQRQRWSARGWKRPGESGDGGVQMGEEVGKGGQGDMKQEEVKAEEVELESASQVKEELSIVPLDAPAKHESSEAKSEEATETVKMEEAVEPSVKLEEPSPAPAMEALPVGGSLF